MSNYKRTLGFRIELDYMIKEVKAWIKKIKLNGIIVY